MLRRPAAYALVSLLSFAPSSRAEPPGVGPVGDPSRVVLEAQALLVRADSGGADAIDARKKAHALGRSVLAKVPGLEDAEDRDADELLNRLASAPSLPPGAAHVTITSFCTLIPTLSIFSQLGAARTCRRGLEFTAKRDLAFEHGAPLRALALYLLRAPVIVGGDAKAALQVADRALAANPAFAPNRLVFAKARFAVDGDTAAWETRLREIVALADDGLGDGLEHHRRAKREAAQRLADHDTAL